MGGDNNIERTQARRRTPAPPGACMRASIYNVFLGESLLLESARGACLQALRAIELQARKIGKQLDWIAIM